MFPLILASADSLGNVIFWHLNLDSNPDKLLAEVCDRLKDYLHNSSLFH
ncbi:MAG: hypothetical protein ACFCUV_15120 [Rivularia sp. (in: cyanobacteria)]